MHRRTRLLRRRRCIRRARAAAPASLRRHPGTAAGAQPVRQWRPPAASPRGRAAAGDFLPDLAYGEDWEFWIRIALQGPVAATSWRSRCCSSGSIPAAPITASPASHPHSFPVWPRSSPTRPCSPASARGGCCDPPADGRGEPLDHRPRTDPPRQTRRGQSMAASLGPGNPLREAHGVAGWRRVVAVAAARVTRAVPAIPNLATELPKAVQCVLDQCACQCLARHFPCQRGAP